MAKQVFVFSSSGLEERFVFHEKNGFCIIKQIFISCTYKQLSACQLQQRLSYRYSNYNNIDTTSNSQNSLSKSIIIIYKRSGQPMRISQSVLSRLSGTCGQLITMIYCYVPLHESIGKQTQSYLDPLGLTPNGLNRRP